MTADSSGTAVYYEVPELGIVRVAGGDAIKVLNGLCTANLTVLPVGGASEAFFPDDRGRVLAHAMVARDAQGVWIVGQIPAPATLAAHIDRFIFREDATPRDVTAQWHARLIDGKQALPLLAATTRAVEAEIAALGSGQLQAAQLPVHFVRLPITGPAARLCMVAIEHTAAWESALTSAGFTAGSADEFESRRVANFWPVCGREISDRSLPQELDRDERAISFTKGCYLGQETVARLDALGEVQKKLCLVRFDTEQPTAAGETLTHDGKEVGKLTSVAPLAMDGSRLALANMRRGSFAAGSSFQVGHSSGHVIEHP